MKIMILPTPENFGDMLTGDFFVALSCCLSCLPSFAWFCCLSCLASLPAWFFLVVSLASRSCTMCLGLLPVLLDVVACLALFSCLSCSCLARHSCLSCSVLLPLLLSFLFLLCCLFGLCLFVSWCGFNRLYQNWAPLGQHELCLLFPR